MDDDYRQRKESFVSDLNGTTLYETGSIVINICASYFLCQVLKCSIPSNGIRAFWTSNYLFEFAILVIPMTLVSTVLSSTSYFFHFILWSIAFLLYFIPKKARVIPTRIQSDPSSSYSRIIEAFRGQILIVTCLCILAVDFPIFPRRYAKTETYGYSGMDLGVGLFALAHGMVSNEARNKPTSLTNLFLENFVLIVLGLVRLISIKYLSYVEHVSEYGIHWNFFLTLCFMKLIGNGLLLFTKKLLPLIFLVLFFHGYVLLDYFHIDKYLIAADHSRTNFLDANREGIYSLGGYVCLYLIGIYIGRHVIRSEREQQYKQMSIEFLLATLVLCLSSVHPSRKLCNISYISSTTGLACMCVAGFSSTHWLLLRKNYSVQSILLKNVNGKALDAFLIGNVLTGIVNLNIQTIDTSTGLSLLIVMVYMGVVTAFVYFCPSMIKQTMKLLKLS